MVAERKHCYSSHLKWGGKVHQIRIQHHERRQRHQHHHLGSQCSYNIGVLQHHYHYDWCTSCDLKNDIKEEEDILATCLHLYDVDVKDGECYTLNLPQPGLPTPAVFDGTTPTFPEWVRELRASTSLNLNTLTSFRGAQKGLRICKGLRMARVRNNAKLQDCGRNWRSTRILTSYSEVYTWKRKRLSLSSSQICQQGSLAPFE